jgi:hypothetical protein
MRLPRFRVRALLILVALAGISAGGIVLWGRSVEYVRRAESADSHEKSCDNLAKRWFAVGPDNLNLSRGYDYGILPPHPDDSQRVAELLAKLPPPSPEELKAFLDSARRTGASSERRRDYYAALRRKYCRAARYPWLPVSPDPPEPE